MDFDAWKRLAESDPSAFEALRRAHLAAAIASAPEERQPQLRRLQWRIEQTRRRAPSPLAACVSLSRMMWEALAGSGGLVEALRMSPSGSRTEAKVIPFHRPQS